MKQVSKTFLSDHPSENGSIVWSVVTPKKVENASHQLININAEIQIRDCHGEPACLNFYTTKSESTDKRIKKIDTLIEELVKFKKAYICGVKDMQKLIKHREKVEK